MSSRPLLGGALALCAGLMLGCPKRPHAGSEVESLRFDGGKSPSVVMVDRPLPVRPRPDRKGLTFIDEREPDDDLQHAQPLELPKGVRGNIGAPTGSGKTSRSDEDFYQWLVGAEVGQSARIEVSGVPGLALTFDVLDGDGLRIASATDGAAGEAQVMPNLAVEPGKTYFIRVRCVTRRGEAPRGDPTHPYELVVLPTPLAPGDEIEPNDSVAAASPITGDASGYFGRRRDEDWLALLGTDLVPGSSTLRLELAAVDDVAASVRIVDAAGRALVETKGQKSEPLRLRNAPTGQGSTFVVLRGESGWSSELRWTLRAQIEPPIAVAGEVEPNGTRESATPIVPSLGAPAATVAGFLWPGDADVYRVHLDGPALVRVDLETPDKSDLKLELLGDGAAARVKVDDGGVGKAEAIPTLYGVAGELFLRVTGRAHDEVFDAPYRLSVALTADDGATEHEPNNTASEATPLDAGHLTMHGFVAPRGDEDWYRVVAPDGALTLKATVAGGPAHAVALKITDESRTPIGPATGAASSVTVQPGKSYFVVVRDPNGKAVSTRDGYTLTVSF